MDRRLRTRAAPNAGAWRTVALLVGAFFLSWIAGLVLSGVIDVQERPRDATHAGIVGPVAPSEKLPESSPAGGRPSRGVAAHLALAGTAMTAGRLRAAQSGYLTVLLSLAPDDGQAQEGLVAVQRRWANDDPAILRRQARTYRLAAVRATEPDSQYSPAALALLADANLRAANEIEIDRVVTARSGASAVPADQQVLSPPAQRTLGRSPVSFAAVRLSPRAQHGAPPRVLSRPVHCSDAQGSPCGVKRSAAVSPAGSAASNGDQEVAARNRHGINLTDMNNNTVAPLRGHVGRGEISDTSPTGVPGNGETPATPKDPGAPPTGTTPAQGKDGEAGGSAHQGPATGSASSSSSGGNPGGIGKGANSAGPSSGGSAGTSGSGSQGGTGGSGSHGGSGGKGSSGQSGGGRGNGGSGGGSGGGHDGHDGQSGGHDRDGNHN
jgi:hypothetical protein